MILLLRLESYKNAIKLKPFMVLAFANSNIHFKPKKRIPNYYEHKIPKLQLYEVHITIYY
jgi:hypothetical protein